MAKPLCRRREGHGVRVRGRDTRVCSTVRHVQLALLLLLSDLFTDCASCEQNGTSPLVGAGAGVCGVALGGRVVLVERGVLWQHLPSFQRAEMAREALGVV